MASIKVVVSEIDGVELEFPTERTLDSADTSFAATTTALVSTNTRDAIEESYTKAISSSKFFLLCAYGALASSGRYLEFYPAISSFDAPISVTGTHIDVTALVIRTVAVTATTSIGFYDIRVPASPVLLYTATMTSQKQIVLKGSVLFEVPANGKLAVKIISGTIYKPHIQIVGKGG